MRIFSLVLTWSWKTTSMKTCQARGWRKLKEAVFIQKKPGKHPGRPPGHAPLKSEQCPRNQIFKVQQINARKNFLRYFQRFILQVTTTINLYNQVQINNFQSLLNFEKKSRTIHVRFQGIYAWLGRAFVVVWLWIVWTFF